jgi:hypothetical protein
METQIFLARLTASTAVPSVVRTRLNASYRLFADWWGSLSPAQQKRYLEKHPRSKKHNLTKKEEPEQPKSTPATETKPSEPKSAPPAAESTKPVKGKAAHKAATPVGLDEAHKQAIKEYTGTMYQSVNQALRKGKPVPAADRKEMKLVDEAFSKAKTTEPLEVYRGIGPMDADKFAGLKVGDTFEDKGFVSTSTDKDTAENFSRGDTPTMMHVQVPKGSKAISVDSMSVFKKGGYATRSENEILLNRGGKFKVLSIKPAKGRQPRVITVEYQDA